MEIQTISKLKAEQRELAKKIITNQDFKSYKLIAGCDETFIDNKVISVIVVCDKDMKVVEVKSTVKETEMKYIPGLLFYRVGAAIIETYNKLENKPDVIVCDFNGILHPRRIGAASQLGLFLDVPTIGVAKTILCGKPEGNNLVIDKEVRATKIITREHAKPVYVSPGHMISLKKSIEVIKSTLRPPHKLPEPLHLAHKYSNKEKEKVIKEDN